MSINLNSNDARQLAKDLRALIKATAPDIYFDELAKHGISREDADPEDEATVKQFIATQYASTLDFASYAVLAKTKKDRAAVDQRLQMWTNSMQSLQDQAKMSAEKNAMGEWKLGHTEEHCSTCQMLNGKRHRLRWFTDKGYIPREPGSETLDCGGWNCDCSIKSDNGRTLI